MSFRGLRPLDPTRKDAPLATLYLALHDVVQFLFGTLKKVIEDAWFSVF